MSKVTPLPSGASEYSPSTYAEFNTLREIVSSVYTSFGYQKLETSPLQYLEVLASGGEISKEIYSIGRAKAEEGSEEANRGLRFDLTKPMARYVAENQGTLVFPFKRTEIGLVYRGERPQKGRFRQFYQADFDVVGRETLSLDYDAEMIEVAASVFEKLAIGKVKLRFNNRKLLQALLEYHGISNDNFPSALLTIDRIEKVGKEITLASLVDNCSVKVDQAFKIYEAVARQIPLAEILFQLQKLTGLTQSLDNAIEEVKFVASLITGSYKNVEILLDLSIARGLEYYTGTVFETNLVGLEKYGSICSGGRYEDLVGDLIQQKFPGVGGSVGLSRLFAILQEEKITVTDLENHTQKIFLAIADPTRTKATREYAHTLRLGEAIVFVASMDTKLKKQFEQAGKLQVDEVHILEDNGEVTIKDMKSGEQTKSTLTK